MHITATEAKNRFGFVCSQAKREPVFVEKEGRVDSVILSVEQFDALFAAGQPKAVAERKLAFNREYSDWIKAHNEHFQAHGVWCDGLVAWKDSI